MYHTVCYPNDASIELPPGDKHAGLSWNGAFHRDSSLLLDARSIHYSPMVFLPVFTRSFQG
jgi:hypothetical protein